MLIALYTPSNKGRERVGQRGGEVRKPWEKSSGKDTFQVFDTGRSGFGIELELVNLKINRKEKSNQGRVEWILRAHVIGLKLRVDIILF
jgi:hypothetical protein